MDKKVEQPAKSKVIKIVGLCTTALGLISVIVFLALHDTNKSNRPQEPKTPLPYYSEDVTFSNTESKVSLAGTLTLPNRAGVFPGVILISGSGPQTRDGEFAGHKQFLVLSDHLTRNGIAVLRYDDRGFGKSTGDFSKGTSLDFSSDVEAALKYLKTRKEISQEKIGLIGHSDGAMIAPMVAARSSDVAFIVLLAGPGIQGAKLLTDRQEIIERKIGLSESEIAKSRIYSEKIVEILMRSPDVDSTKFELIKFSKEHYNEIPAYAVPVGMSKDKFIAMQIDFVTSPWFKYFITYDPVKTLKEVKCPVLALNGELDVQVPSRDNLAAIEASLKSGGNSDVITHEIPKLNHAFQECITGMPDEYAKIEQTFSPVALGEITTWVISRTK